MINKPLFPTPGAPITASFTSERVDFFLRTWNRNIFVTLSYIWQGLGLPQTIFWSKFLSSCFLDIKLCGLLLSCPTIRFILDENKFKSLLVFHFNWYQMDQNLPAGSRECRCSSSSLCFSLSGRVHLCLKFIFHHLVTFHSPIVFVTLLHGSFWFPLCVFVSSQSFTFPFSSSPS